MNSGAATRIRAMLTWLLDSGDITPMGVRMIEKILQEEER